MPKIIHNFLTGLGRVLAISPDRAYIRPSCGFRNDAELMKQDVRRVGNGLRKKLNQFGYGKASNCNELDDVHSKYVI